MSIFIYSLRIIVQPLRPGLRPNRVWKKKIEAQKFVSASQTIQDCRQMWNLFKF